MSDWRQLALSVAVAVMVAAAACPKTRVKPAARPGSADLRECPPPVVAAPATCPKCPTCPIDNPQPDGLPARTCIVGAVKTAGDMVFVVQRADVALKREDKPLGATRTDAGGHFVWCTPTGAIASGVEVTVIVSKPPFEPSEAAIEWQTGQHAIIMFALEAEGLTN